MESGHGIAEAARSLEVVEQTLSNWVRAHRGRTLKEVSGKPGVKAEQMEIARLRAQLSASDGGARQSGKATAYFAKDQK